MTKQILFLVLTINLGYCQSQTETKYADELQSCLTSIDVKILNKATKQFERKLNEYFGEENLNENYISFLNALSKVSGSPKFSRDFFLIKNH